VFFQRSIECKIKAPESKLDLSNSVESFLCRDFMEFFCTEIFKFPYGFLR